MALGAWRAISVNPDISFTAPSDGFIFGSIKLASGVAGSGEIGATSTSTEPGGVATVGDNTERQCFTLPVRAGGSYHLYRTRVQNAETAFFYAPAHLVEFNLEDCLEVFKCTLPNGNEKNIEDENVLLTDKMIILSSARITKTQRVIIIRLMNDSDAEKALIPDSKYTISNEGLEKCISFIQPIFEPIDFASIFSKSLLIELGDGRVRCKSWYDWECHHIRYDRDCVEMNDYLSRADDVCDETCADWTAYWTSNPNC